MVNEILHDPKKFGHCPYTIGTMAFQLSCRSQLGRFLWSPSSPPLPKGSKLKKNKQNRVMPLFRIFKFENFIYIKCIIAL